MTRIADKRSEPVIPPASLPLGSFPPPRVIAGLLLAVLIDVPVQLVWKWAMTRYAGSAAASPLWFVRQPCTYLLIGLFLVQFFNWMWVLGNADLSYAQPITALSYVAISGAAAILFHEHLSPLRIAGILLILAGVALVGSTRHQTAGGAA